MRKILESSLLPIITSNFGQGLRSALELSSGFGIADVVFYRLNEEIVQYRVKQKIKPIESYDIIKSLTTLNQINSKIISLTFLKNSILSTKKQQSNIISYLLENRFLLPNKGSAKEFIKGFPYRIGLQEVVAIEAKLMDWRRGLYQAYRYKQYSNKSYLALYSKYIHRALKHKQEFIKSNVGLLEVTSNEIKIHVRPRKESIRENIYSAYVYETLLGTKEKHHSMKLKTRHCFPHSEQFLHL